MTVLVERQSKRYEKYMDSLFRFSHKEAPVIYYGFGKSVSEAQRDILKILNFKPEGKNSQTVKDRWQRLVDLNVVPNHNGMNFNRDDWVVTRMLNFDNKEQFVRLVNEIIITADHSKVLILNYSDKIQYSRLSKLINM